MSNGTPKDYAAYEAAEQLGKLLSWLGYAKNADGTTCIHNLNQPELHSAAKSYGKFRDSENVFRC